MTTPNFSQNDSDSPNGSYQTWAFDKCFDPRTIPAHWDLSELMAPVKTSMKRRTGRSVQTQHSSETDHESTRTPSENDKSSEAITEYHHNLFIDPKTSPRHWDSSW
jgi:hypothetical protein